MLAAHGPHGEQVELVLMAPGPALDAAARDRFAAAAERVGAEHPGRLVEVSTHGPLAWAALRGGSGPELAQPLLDAPLPEGSATAPGSGPAFAPHWSTAPQAYPPPPPLMPLSSPPESAGPWWRRWWWVALLVLAVVLLLLLLSSCLPRDDAATTPEPAPTGSTDPGPTPSDSGPPTTPGPTGSQGSPAPSNEADGPTQDLQAGPGVAGPGFTRDDRTVEMRLAGLPFPFRVPEGWECVQDTTAVEPVVRYTCTDGTSDGATLLRPPSGIVQVEPCPGLCGDAEWDALRNRANDDDGWVLVDPTTAAALDVDPGLPLYERIRMSRIWSPIGAEMPDTHLYTEFTAPPQLFGVVQKITNDIRANTP